MRAAAAGLVSPARSRRGGCTDGAVAAAGATLGEAAAGGVGSGAGALRTKSVATAMTSASRPAATPAQTSGLALPSAIGRNWSVALGGLGLVIHLVRTLRKGGEQCLVGEDVDASRQTFRTAGDDLDCRLREQVGTVVARPRMRNMR